MLLIYVNTALLCCDLGPSFPVFDAPPLRVFVLVCLKGETLRRIMDDHLVAVGAELFSLPWGFKAAAIVAITATAAAAATATAATLEKCHQEFGVLCHDFCELLPLLREFSLQNCEAIVGRRNGCAFSCIYGAIFV